MKSGKSHFFSHLFLNYFIFVDLYVFPACFSIYLLKGIMMMRLLQIMAVLSYL